MRFPTQELGNIDEKLCEQHQVSRPLRKEFAVKLQRNYHRPVFWSRSYCIISWAPLST